MLSLLLAFSTSAFAGGFSDFISGASRWEEPENIHDIHPDAKRLIIDSLKDLPGVIDTHLHLICREEKNSCYVPTKLFSTKSHPISTFKTHIFLSALGIRDEKDTDAQLVQRIEKLIRNFPSKPYVAMMFAYAASYDADTHKKLLEKTGLEVPNAYMLEVVKKNPQSLIPVYSLHPFQENLEKEFAKLKNARFFKILPNSMNFSPDDEKCSTFFELLAKNESILITHVGDEHSIEGGGINNAFGNPLLFEKWLKRFPKLRIIFAHAGGVGKHSFKDVQELMRKYPLQTYADISAFSLNAKIVQYIPELLEASDLHPRLLYGSDYPVVAIKPMLSATLFAMYWKGLLGNWKEFNARYNAIIEIYNYNPLLASVVIMRLVSFKGKQLPPEVFFENAWRLIGKDFEFSRTLSGAKL